MSALPRPKVWGPVTRTDLVRYAGASGDFNPLHHDPDFARSAGLADVMAHGMYGAGLLATALRDWYPQDAITGFTTRFRMQVWLGDVLEARCLSIDGDGGTRVVEFGLFRDTDLVISDRATLEKEWK